MPFSPDLQAKLNALLPERQKVVVGNARKLAKASMRKMLDQTAANHQKRQAAKRISAENEPQSVLDPEATPSF